MSKQYIKQQKRIRNNIKSHLFELKDIAPIKNSETALVFDRLTYLIFTIGLLPGNNESEDILERLSMLYTSVMNVTGDWAFAPDVENMINEIYCATKKQFPLKVGIKKVASVLRAQLIKDQFHNGIELGVMSKIIDLRNIPYLKEELPYYSRIGLGFHSNRCVNEELQLLDDAFYLLALAIKEYNKMHLYENKLPKIKTEKNLNVLTYLNSNVCSFCRNSVVGFYAFFESYINGLCLNYLYYHEDELSEEDKFMLEGKDRTGNKYLKMSRRLEQMQRIIAKKITYNTNNPQQLKDNDFIILLAKMQERRDVAEHYSKLKGEIMFAPQEWLDEAQSISQVVINVSKKIWDACFLNADHYPYYLREFRYDYFFSEAKKRILDIENQT